jgi:hypothetical protein
MLQQIIISFNLLANNVGFATRYVDLKARDTYFATWNAGRLIKKVKMQI